MQWSKFYFLMCKYTCCTSTIRNFTEFYFILFLKQKQANVKIGPFFQATTLFFFPQEITTLTPMLNQCLGAMSSNWTNKNGIKLKHIYQINKNLYFVYFQFFILLRFFFIFFLSSLCDTRRRPARCTGSTEHYRYINYGHC
jgi:hypothetical protein